MRLARNSIACLFAAGLAVAAATSIRHPLAAQGPAAAPAGAGGRSQSASPGSTIGAGGGAGVGAAGTMPDMPGMPGMTEMDGPAAGGADGAMSHETMEMGLHMKMTAPRSRTAEDQRRADAIVETLRGAIARYRDYRVAVADGFVEFLPKVRQPMYHFTNYSYAFKAASGFDATRPTSLLYKPTPGGGFELVGAMYTAPRRFSEEQLDERVPLSVAAWHQHVNLCLPPKSAYATSDWHKFGFKGTIATEQECRANGGVFHPVVFGWMVHAYPFEKDPAKVWAH